jgi:branched-chain amino acid transport system permease protein
MKVADISYRNLAIYGVLLMLGLFLPFIVRSGYITHVLIISCIWIMMTTGYNLVLGYTGLFSFGHAGFIAIGAYSSTLLVMNYNLPWPVGLVFAGVMCAAFALLTGVVVLRLGGVYFAFITLGFGEIIRVLILILGDITEGHFGIPGVPPLFDSLTTTYMFAFMMMMLVFLIVYRIVHSRIGRALIAVRENPNVAASIGVNVTRYSLLAFVISAVICGVGGAMLVHYLSVCYPSLAQILTSVDLIIFTKLGGRGTLIGPAVAAFLFTFFPEMFRFIDEWRPLIYALTLVVVLLMAPMGLEPAVRSLISRAITYIRSKILSRSKYGVTGG